jgi:hypothetical protein
VCRGFNAGFSSPAACDDGFDAAERLATGKSSKAVMDARGADFYKARSFVRKDGGEWDTHYDPPPAHIYAAPEYAVAVEKALQNNYDLTWEPEDAWTERLQEHRKHHGQLYLSITICMGVCVGLTVTEEGHTFVNASATASGAPSVGASVTIGMNSERMEQMSDQGGAVCGGGVVTGCATIGWDAETGKPVYGGSVSIGLGGQNGVQRTYSHRFDPNK